ncbi:MAG: UTP--glucose-1-phosphate uridylyltransferase [Parachlamydiaceae bacterium]
MKTPSSLKEQIDELKELLSSLATKKNYREKVNILNDLPMVKEYLVICGPIQKFLARLSAESEYAIKAIMAIGQAPIVFNIKNMNEDIEQKLITLLEHLLEIETFYNFLGGIIGYHYTTLHLLYQKINGATPSFDHLRYIHPRGLNLIEESADTRQAIRWGIENIQHISVIYPLGGAGDRLNLKDESTGNSLPAALLPFLGHTLLDSIVHDLQALEYLAFKLLGKQSTTPIALMTSIEKNNHLHILNICKTSNWFGRGEENFYFFIQPLAPVITIEGNWSLSSHLTLTLKPSGHGVLWKLAQEVGVFKWLESHGRHECLIRQVNNPLASTDQGVLTLIGIGCKQQKAFGFLSCQRLLYSDEGTNVIIETEKQSGGYDYCLTNIEYPEFNQRGIGEIPAKPGSPYSLYPTNTNILFANIRSIQEALKTCPLPGQLINMKSEVPYLNADGELSFMLGGRLESTMQNIADHLTDHFSHRLDEKDYQTALQTFILCNSRSKTISTTKKSYKKGLPPIETPEQAFYDILSNHRELLIRCQFEMPPHQSIDEHLAEGPSFIFLFHPGLGPLYAIITQKIRKGRLFPGAELQLDMAEVDIEELSLQGSLVIEAQSPLGTIKEGGFLEYGNESRCSLRRVFIQNEGIDRSIEQHYWKNAIKRKEGVKIILGEGAEFHAEDLTLKGSHVFEVPDRHRLTAASDGNGGVEIKLRPIEKPTWQWHYSFDSENAIKLVHAKI